MSKTWSPGRSSADLVASYPHLTLADVHAALAYYHDHRDQIDRQIQEDEEFVAQFRAEYAARSHDPDADGHPVSS